MARLCGAVCRLCRREGEKLFLKGERCYTNKCAIERRESAPGQHGKARQSHSDFKIQLREKQKVKRIFGVLERGFENSYKKAAKAKGVTGTELLMRMERRIDNIVYRLGFASSRRQGRQLVNHGHVLVNGKCVSIPSYLIAAGDNIEVVEGNKQNPVVTASMASAESRVIPSWLVLDKSNARGTVTSLPTREQMVQNVREQLIVEHYNR